jgi:hypothetical protein
MTTEHWKDDPDEHDYPAARQYLSLLVVPKTAKTLTKSLRNAPLRHAKAKDLLRASHLELLPADDPEVLDDLKKVHDGVKLSPVLLVRGTLGVSPLIIADGYHRICASYHIDEDTEIPYRIGDVPTR